MGYILKNTSGLINTKITDAGIQKISQGTFNISYFQIGDSEVSYNTLPTTYNQYNTNILAPNANSQNFSPLPQGNKQYIKYPFYFKGDAGNTYGVPFMESVVSPVYNRAALRGFFIGNLTADTTTWSALTNNQYVVNPNYVVDMSTLNGSNVIDITSSICNQNPLRQPQVGDFVTIYYDGNGLTDCLCTGGTQDCYLSGFVGYFLIGESTFAYVYFENTNQYLNGKPIFSTTYFFTPLTIYWTGSLWVLETFDNFIIPLTSGSTPITTIDFFGNTGYTACLENPSICVSLCENENPNNCVTSPCLKLETSGITIYNGQDFLLEYSSPVWAMSDFSGVIAILTGLTINDSPVGTWSGVSGLYSAYTITTTKSSCSQGFSCNCISITAETGNDTIKYQDCNLVFQQENIISGNTIEICSFGHNFLDSLINNWVSLSGNSYGSLSCTGITCNLPLLNSLNKLNPDKIIINDCFNWSITNFNKSSSATIQISGCCGQPNSEVIVQAGETIFVCASTTPKCISSEIICSRITISDTGKQCPCITPTPVTPTPTPPTPTPPVPTPTVTNTPTIVAPCQLELPFCSVGMDSCHNILTYKIVGMDGFVLTLDRPTPNLSMFSNLCYARLLIYPPNMEEIYDINPPQPNWIENIIDYESVCGQGEFDVKVWNMNIPWSENPAGLNPNIYKDFSNFGSVSYLGTKEYLGYASNSGQTNSSPVYYYNSFDERIVVEPKDQKAIAIIHYTNKTIDDFYGEKFALEPYDPSNPFDTTGEARNFKLHIPWLMWHKGTNCCNGQTFYVDPPGFDDLLLFQVHHMTSKLNMDMNTPGLRYYNLWDTNPNDDGYPSRIGKVFPDDKIIVIDDEEIIAAMSYKSNRNWTLPAPKISLIEPNICGSNIVNGILSGSNEYMYVTYRLKNTNSFSDSLHCNYYSIIQGPNVDCQPLLPQNVALRFGPEFNCLNQTDVIMPEPNSNCWLTGFTITYTTLGTGISFFYYPTGEITNGKPSFGTDSGAVIYWDGSQWVTDSRCIPVDGYLLPLTSESSPLTTIITGDTTIQTYCGNYGEGICFNLCFGFECQQSSVPFTYSVGGQTFYPLDVNSDIEYSGSSWVWNNSGNIVATLSALTENDKPIGIWDTSMGIYSAQTLTSSLGLCTDDKYCSCVSLTAVTGDDLIFYQNCNRGLSSFNLISGQTEEICVFGFQSLDDSLKYSWNDLSGNTSGTVGCTGITCNFPLTLPISIYSTFSNNCGPFCDIPQGFLANKFEIICQKVSGNTRPVSSNWKVIDFTDLISASTYNTFLTQSGLTGTTFVITDELYNSAPTYVLDYLNLPLTGNTGITLNFGDEYYFYGSLETDIEATIYEMRYKVSLGQAEFQRSSNPSWSSTKKSYITEIGLYDSDKNLMIMSKLISPIPRQGNQHFYVKLDF